MSGFPLPRKPYPPWLALPPQDVSWRMMPGHRVGLVGSNGCGKSTLLRCLTGVNMTRTTGRIQLAHKVGAWGRGGGGHAAAMPDGCQHDAHHRQDTARACGNLARHHRRRERVLAKAQEIRVARACGDLHGTRSGLRGRFGTRSQRKGTEYCDRPATHYLRPNYALRFAFHSSRITHHASYLQLTMSSSVFGRRSGPMLERSKPSGSGFCCGGQTY